MLNSFKTPRRVVITGMGCVTPIGIGREAFWSGLQRGESGVRRIESFDVSDSPVKIAAEVRDFDWEAELNSKDRKHVPRTVPLVLASAREALTDAGVLPDELPLEQRRSIGVEIGTGGCGVVGALKSWLAPESEVRLMKSDSTLFRDQPTALSRSHLASV